VMDADLVVNQRRVAQAAGVSTAAAAAAAAAAAGGGEQQGQGGQQQQGQVGQQQLQLANGVAASAAALCRHVLRSGARHPNMFCRHATVLVGCLCTCICV
jgi:hypothetical protein